MRALARIVAERAPHGGTRLSVLHGESPLLLRRTGPPSRAGVTVHLVGGAAGPLRGDDLRLEIEVGPEAVLTVRSVAAQLALPGRPGLPPSRLEVRATVAAGATLSWLPEPLIAAAGCDHHTLTHVEAAAGATLLWRDDLVCGRHAEESGNVRTTTTVRYAGRTLYRHDLAVGPGAPGWTGAAVLGSGRAVGTLVAAPGLPRVPSPTPTAAVMPLAGPGVLATAVGADLREVRAALDPLCPAATVAPDPPAARSSSAPAADTAVAGTF
jgi:urease accessory protein